MEEYEKQQIRDAGRGHLVDPPVYSDDLSQRQVVMIDGGDLSELCQSAEAWAGFLRRKAEDMRKEFGALPAFVADADRYEAAADRIDQAVHRARRDSHESLQR